jgi:hypothetical protein
MLSHHGTLSRFPVTIKARLLESESETQTARTRRRYPALAHLPLSAIFTICEADLSELLPQESLAPFQAEIDARAQRRAAEEARRKEEAGNVQRREHDAPLPPLSSAELSSMPVPGEVSSAVPLRLWQAF